MGMSVISFNKFASLISETSSSGGLCGQIRSILVLQYLLDHLEEQDFYFQMGRKNHGERLAEMKKQYDAAINYGNSKTVVELFAETEKAKDTINFLHTRACKYPIFAKILIEGKLLSEIQFCESLIEAKGLFGTLMPIEDTVHNKEVLRQVFS